ncbi:MAG: thiamine pyrophosphate-dependent enzyme [Chloroflexota bacterium]
MQNQWAPETLRAFEEDIKEIFLAGEIRAPIHLSGGNEKMLLEVFKEVKAEDWVFSTHRSHYHALLKGVPAELVRSEILAGRSIHLNFKDYNFMSSAIVGACLPIAVGVAMAIKRKGEDRKAWCFVGDMAATTGIFHECVTYAKNFALPLCVVVECNALSTNTPTDEVWGTMHDHNPEAGVRVVDDWGDGKVLKYCYDRGDTPHIGAGAWVTFS